MDTGWNDRWPNYVRIAATAWLALCIAAFVVCSMRWHVVSDLAQLNYICFLMQHGMALYRDILEVNMPGTFLVNCGVMHIFGNSDLAWRWFDLALLASAGLAMFSITRPYGWFAGVLAGSLFALLHGHGGEEQLAQRDLIVAVLLLLAYAFLFAAMRRGRDWPFMLAGACISAAATIKPPAALTLLLLLPVVIAWLRRERRNFARPALLCVMGVAIPLLGVLWFLAREHSVSQFVHTVTHILPAYSGIGRKGFWYLLRASKIAPLLVLWTGLAAALAWMGKSEAPAQRMETWLLALGAVFGAAYYFIQGKGFPYHLYPWAAFSILWSSIEIARSLPNWVRHPARSHRAGPQTMAQWFGYAGLMLAVVIAPAFAVHAIRTPEIGHEFNDALTADLNSLGGQQLTGHVQCLVTSGECAMVLHQMRLVQATGLIYDFMVFGPNPTAIQQEMRARTWEQLMQNPPEVIVVRSYLWPSHPCSLNIADGDAAAWEQARYAKLTTWPEFSQMLEQEYHLDREHTFAEIAAPCRFAEGYRIYLRTK